MLDTLGRPLHDLRISVTDRCNFRCRYCMPKEVFGRDYVFLARDLLLTFEEITRLTRIASRLGVHKVRLTGGEPLLRRGLDRLVGMISVIEGIEDLTLTTNGTLLARKAEALADAGLHRVTVSLDSLDDAVFRAMNDVDFPVQGVLEAISAAADVGLAPIKINSVVKRGFNEDGLVDMIEYFRGTGHVVRFIEYMDVGTTNGWRLDHVVSAAEMLDRIRSVYEVEPLEAAYRGEVAKRWRLTDGSAEFGLIASVTQPFCGDCTRLRLSADGSLYTCLFATSGTDLRPLLRAGASDEAVAEAIGAVWSTRVDRYSELRSVDTVGLAKVEMSFIGG
ncbi:MAG TPA: GTP 3',8-cyclase MoaA [Acidimicrobiia bacterium]